MSIVVHARPGQERFALTFDDGPEPGVTEPVLDLLARRGARATFFCVGEQVERSPELARELAYRGHEVGSHTQRHLDHQSVERAEALRDALDGAATLERTLGTAPRLYRAPYGRFAPGTLALAQERGWTCVLWSAWGRDWLPDDGPTIAGRVLEDLDGGGIVLLHDSARYAHEREDSGPTIEAAELVLTEAERRGLHAVTVGELLAGG